jgi:hypothetical protein
MPIAGATVLTYEILFKAFVFSMEQEDNTLCMAQMVQK